MTAGIFVRMGAGENGATPMIDTHIHLYDEKYQPELTELIAAAREAGVREMIVAGYDRESSLQAIALAEKHDFVYATVGLHPSDVARETDTELSWLKELVKHPRVVGVGEIGLDYYWDKTYVELQKEYFQMQIGIATEQGLPIVVHSRAAAADTFQILSERVVPGVLHCYSMSLELAREFVKLGYFLGIGGVLTFKNSREIKDVVREIPLANLLAETDGPYLAPEPHRGKLNKPEYLRLVVEKIAEIKAMPLEAVIAVFRENTKKLFSI
jgi:TatD DNase family protein